MRTESIGPLGRIGLSGRSAAVGRASPSAHPVGDAMTMRTTVHTEDSACRCSRCSPAPACSPWARWPTPAALAGSALAAGTPTSRTAVHTTGIATWFGPGFYGKKTACGQTMTPGIVGVANRTLPCGTLVKVSYQGHLLTVPVIDRGPYSHIGADWDLTAGAARTLGRRRNRAHRHAHRRQRAQHPHARTAARIAHGRRHRRRDRRLRAAAATPARPPAATERPAPARRVDAHVRAARPAPPRRARRPGTPPCRPSPPERRPREAASGLIACTSDSASLLAAIASVSGASSQ